MNIKELVGNIKSWISQNATTKLRKEWEWWHEEMVMHAENRNLGREEREYFLKTPFEKTVNVFIDDVMNDFVGNLKSDLDSDGLGRTYSSIARDCQYAFDEIEDEAIDMAGDYYDNDEVREEIANKLTHELDNPFLNLDGYYWLPIVIAMDEIGFGEKELRNLRGTMGQILVIAFYLQGNDDRLDRNYIDAILFDY